MGSRASEVPLHSVMKKPEIETNFSVRLARSLVNIPRDTNLKNVYSEIILHSCTLKSCS
jgi:hypothetical protein